jgi:hypothetical protein
MDCSCLVRTSSKTTFSSFFIASITFSGGRRCSASWTFCYSNEAKNCSYILANDSLIWFIMFAPVAALVELRPEYRDDDPQAFPD